MNFSIKFFATALLIAFYSHAMELKPLSELQRFLLEAGCNCLNHAAAENLFERLVWERHFDSAKLLIRKGFSIDSQWAQSQLYHAFFLKDTEDIIKFFMKYNAHVDKDGIINYSLAYDLMSIINNPERLELLLENGNLDKNNLSFAAHAIVNENSKIFNIALHYDAPLVNNTSNVFHLISRCFNNVPFHDVAIKNMHIVKQKIDIDDKDASGNTPLKIALSHGFYNVMLIYFFMNATLLADDIIDLENKEEKIGDEIISLELARVWLNDKKWPILKNILLKNKKYDTIKALNQLGHEHCITSARTPMPLKTLCLDKVVSCISSYSTRVKTLIPEDDIWCERPGLDKDGYDCALREKLRAERPYEKLENFWLNKK